MKFVSLYLVCLFFGILTTKNNDLLAANNSNDSAYDPTTDSLRFPGEIHFRNIRQLTFGGNNAEAYWSFDSKQLIFQSDWDKINKQGCDQQFIMNADGSPLANGEQYQLVSTGKGRTTCGYFMPDGSTIFASTHKASAECPEVKHLQGRYVWGIFQV